MNKSEKIEIWNKFVKMLGGNDISLNEIKWKFNKKDKSIKWSRKKGMK